MAFPLPEERMALAESITLMSSRGSELRFHPGEEGSIDKDESAFDSNKSSPFL
jgi:hypothetical protein